MLEMLQLLKYPLGESHDYDKEFNSLSHEISCTLILHANLGFLNSIVQY